jgi:uncharacterized protein (TIGR00297 family)
MDLLKGYLFGIGYASVCLLLSLLIYKLGVPKKLTRKFVHILVGFEWVILYHYFGAGLHFLAVCLFFLALLFVSYRMKLMPMISSENENAPGTVYYAVAMSGVAIIACFIPGVMVPFGIGIMCTSLGDGFAGVVGQSLKKYNPEFYGKKTVFGFIANFIMSFASALVISKIYSAGLLLWHCLAIAFLSSTLELVTGMGLDNITITWGVTALAYGFIYFENINSFIVPILLSPIVIGFAVKKKALTYGGVVMAIVLDALISFSLGNFGFVLLISFFFGAMLIDKFKKRMKKQGRTDEAEKGDCRDYMQVIANGLLAGISAVLFFASGNKVFLFAFIAALAEAMADTASSGIGVAAHRTYDVWKRRRCEMGLSGGMSLIGTFAAFVASYAMAMIAYAFGAVNIVGVVIITISAFLGSVFDSLLGSLVQAKYKCRICGKITEKGVHCGESTNIYSGLAFIDNDCVNLLSGIFAAVMAGVLSLLV